MQRILHMQDGYRTNMLKFLSDVKKAKTTRKRLKKGRNPSSLCSFIVLLSIIKAKLAALAGSFT